MARVIPIEIRTAQAQHKEAWIGLWTEWQRHMKGAIPTNVTDRAWQRALEPDSGLLILLAFAPEDQPIGFATVSFTPFAWTGSEIAFLQDLFVTERARGLGAGAALLCAVYAQADEQGATQVFWMVDETDEKLQRFYERNAIRTPYLRYMRGPWPW
jgi:GNAT superfamily N-acetyltransferase